MKIPRSLFLITTLLIGESFAAEFDPHEGFAAHMDITSQMRCQIKIKPPIIKDTPYDYPDRTDDENLAGLAKSMGWNSAPPFELYNGDCAITNPMEFLSGNAAIIHALPHQEDIADTEHYFFYIRRFNDGADITYSISWNGYKVYTHAQWFLTEEAEMNRLSNGYYCLTDKKIDLCLK